MARTILLLLILPYRFKMKGSRDNTDFGKGWEGFLKIDRVIGLLGFENANHGLEQFCGILRCFL